MSTAPTLETIIATGGRIPTMVPRPSGNARVNFDEKQGTDGSGKKATRPNEFHPRWGYAESGNLRERRILEESVD